MSKTFFPNLAGIIAIFIWPITSLLVCKVRHIPVTEILAITSAIAFLTTAVRLSFCRKWGSLRQPIKGWIYGTLLIAINQFTFVAAYQYAPAEQVKMIIFLWPILVVLFSGLLPYENLSMDSLISAILGFFGIAILFYSGGDVTSMYPNWLFGYMIAFICAASWAIYTLYSRYQSHHSTEFCGLYFGIISLVSFAIHVSTEETIIPTFYECIFFSIIGIAGAGTSFCLWDYGVKKGDFQMLSIFSYGKPILGIGLLILFGESEANVALAISLLIVMVACSFSFFKNIWLRPSLQVSYHQQQTS